MQLEAKSYHRSTGGLLHRQSLGLLQGATATSLYATSVTKVLLRLLLTDESGG